MERWLVFSRDKFHHWDRIGSQNHVTDNTYFSRWLTNLYLGWMIDLGGSFETQESWCRVLVELAAQRWWFHQENKVTSCVQSYPNLQDVVQGPNIHDEYTVCCLPCRKLSLYHIRTQFSRQNWTQDDAALGSSSSFTSNIQSLFPPSCTCFSPIL